MCSSYQSYIEREHLKVHIFQIFKLSLVTSVKVAFCDPQPCPPFLFQKLIFWSDYIMFLYQICLADLQTGCVHFPSTSLYFWENIVHQVVCINTQIQNLRQLNKEQVKASFMNIYWNKSHLALTAWGRIKIIGKNWQEPRKKVSLLENEAYGELLLMARIPGTHDMRGEQFG